MSEAHDQPRRGYTHVHTDEELRRFRALSVEEKLEWLESMRSFLARFHGPKQREIMNRFRRGDI